MRFPRFDEVMVGDELPVVEKPPLSRGTLALFADASADRNPVHIDIDAARAAGLPDVVGHGMLTMAYLGQVLTGWVRQSAIRSYSARFVAPTCLGDALTCTARVVEKQPAGSQGTVRLELKVVDQFGEVKVLGEAEVQLG